MFKRIVAMFLSIVLFFCCALTVFAVEEKTESVTELATKEVIQSTTELVTEKEVDRTELTEETDVEKISFNTEYQYTAMLLIFVVVSLILCVVLLK